MTDLYNYRAERNVLGSILLDPAFIGDILCILEPDDFADTAHAAIFKTMQKLKIEGTPIDYLSVEAAMSPMDTVDSGTEMFPLLTELTNETVSPANVMHHARLVKRASVARGVDNALRDGLERLENGEQDDDVVAIVRGAAEMASAALEPHNSTESLGKAFDALGDVQTGKKSAVVETGFADLDMYAPGVDELCIIAARPSTGKTALGLAVAEKIADNGPVLFFSLEMSLRSIHWRRIAMNGRVALDKMRKNGGMTERDWDQATRAAGGMKKSQLTVLDRARSLGQICTEVERSHSKEPLRAVFLDHLLLMRMPKGESRTLQIADSTNAFHHLTGRLGIPMFVLTQLNRNSEHRTDSRPILSDLRDSGAIEQDGDVVWLLDRPDRFNISPSKNMEVICAKNRNGPIGACELYYDPRTGHFEDKRWGE